MQRKSSAARQIRKDGRYADVSELKSEGVTYTPRVLADFVAGQIVATAKIPASRPVRVLDPAVGHGELLVALLARLQCDVKVFGFETDLSALNIARDRLSEAFPHARLAICAGSFLDHVADDFAGGLFSENASYDLIIANPPYVRTQIMGAERAQMLARQFNLSGRVDLYHAFLLGISAALGSDGTAGIIVSNRFMTTRGGAATREALLSRTRMTRIFDLGDTKLFDAAVLPAVLIASGGRTDEASPPEFSTIYETQEASTQRVLNPIEALKVDGIVESSDGRRFKVVHGRLDNGGHASGVWRLGSTSTDEWLAKVSDNTWGTFRDIGRVKVGVKTTADKVFIPKSWDEDLELHRQLTTHHVARRYKALPISRKILYPHESVDGRKRAVDIDQYPRSRTYLEKHRDVLQARTYVIDAGRKWYEIWVPQNPDEWASPKLVFRDISERPMFWMDESGSIVNGDCYWLSGPPELLWLALAVANSTFIEHFYDHRFNNKLYSGRRRFITQYVEEFPIPDPSTALAKDIARRAKVIYESAGEPNVALLESELDDLVWQAFGMSRKEVGR